MAEAVRKLLTLESLGWQKRGPTLRRCISFFLTSLLVFILLIFRKSKHNSNARVLSLFVSVWQQSLKPLAPYVSCGKHNRLTVLNISQIFNNPELHVRSDFLSFLYWACNLKGMTGAGGEAPFNWRALLDQTRAATIIFLPGGIQHWNHTLLHCMPPPYHIFFSGIPPPGVK